jgi:hypothetical protein
MKPTFRASREAVSEFNLQNYQYVMIYTITDKFGILTQ